MLDTPPGRHLTYASDPRAEAFFSRYKSRNLNLGAGADIRDGYINVDMHDYGRENTMVGDVMTLPTLPSDNFDEIVAQDVIEHIRWRDTPAVLAEWNRLLAVGGILYIRSTWLNGLTRLFELPQNQPIPHQMILLRNLFSNQLGPGDFHMTAFTEPLLRFYMWSCNFKIVKLTIMDQWAFELWAEKEGSIFSNDLLHSREDDQQFVQSAYQHVLGRQADDTGLSIFDGHLKRGQDRYSVLTALFASDENQNRLAATAPSFPSTLIP